MFLAVKLGVLENLFTEEQVARHNFSDNRFYWIMIFGKAI